MFGRERRNPMKTSGLWSTELDEITLALSSLKTSLTSGGVNS